MDYKIEPVDYLSVRTCHRIFATAMHSFTYALSVSLGFGNTCQWNFQIASKFHKLNHYPKHDRASNRTKYSLSL